MVRVYQFGLLPPTDNAVLVRSQIRAAHEHRNDLVAIERGRRSALRALHETPEVRAALELVRAATRSDRRDALRTLDQARRDAEREARCPGGHWTPPNDEMDRYPYSPLYEKERIALFDTVIRRDARALTACYWGSYLTIEASADQVRKSPLYESDGVTISEPRFVRWRGETPRERGEWLGEGQIGIQLQGGLATPDALSGTDTRAALLILRSHTVGGSEGGRRKTVSEGQLWVRVGSEGRAPVWAKWPIKLHRAIPDNATWKWVRVSCRREGPRERWTCEITLEIPGDSPRALDTGLEGAIAIELLWLTLEDGSMRVATWLDSQGARGEILLPTRIAVGIRKPDGIRSVRDLELNKLRPELATKLRESKDTLPRWLKDAAASLHLWKSPERFHRLAQRWRLERCNAVRDAYELLEVWERRDRHLWGYESGARRESLLERREFYRTIAAQWSRQYRAALIPDRDLTREARWGDESDRRFTAAPQELRGALRHTFGDGAIDIEWRGPHGVMDEDLEWKEVAIERWRSGQNTEGARSGEKDKKTGQVPGGAWAKRKAKKRQRPTEDEGARESTTNRAK